MQRNINISSLFDQSGNLTLQAMELYLEGKLDREKLSAVEEHLKVSLFDREAVDGLKKHGGPNMKRDVDELHRKIADISVKLVSTARPVKVMHISWYVAAGIVLLAGISLLLFNLIKEPAVDSNLAVNNTVTINEEVIKTPKETEAPVIVQDDGNKAIEQEINDKKGGATIKIDDIENDIQTVDDEQLSPVPQMAEEIVISAENDIVMQEAEPVKSEEEQIFMVVEQMPEFPGGEEKLYRFLSDNLIYPQTAKESGVQGRVFVTFVVEKDGSVSDVCILRGIGGGCDEEALRIVKSMPKWIPGKQRGIPIRVQYNLPIKFTLQ